MEARGRGTASLPPCRPLALLQPGPHPLSSHVGWSRAGHSLWGGRAGWPPGRREPARHSLAPALCPAGQGGVGEHRGRGPVWSLRGSQEAPSSASTRNRGVFGGHLCFVLCLTSPWEGDGAIDWDCTPINCCRPASSHHPLRPGPSAAPPEYLACKAGDGVEDMAPWSSEGWDRGTRGPGLCPLWPWAGLSQRDCAV